MVTINADGKIMDVNIATVTVTGFPRHELIGNDFSDYFTDPAQARQVYEKVFAVESVTNHPLTIRHRDGHLMDVLYNATVYRDADGAVLGVFAAARDSRAGPAADPPPGPAPAIPGGSRETPHVDGHGIERPSPGWFGIPGGDLVGARPYSAGRFRVGVGARCDLPESGPRRARPSESGEEPDPFPDEP